MRGNRPITIVTLASSRKEASLVFRCACLSPAKCMASATRVKIKDKRRNARVRVRVEDEDDDETGREGNAELS